MIILATGQSNMAGAGLNFSWTPETNALFWNYTGADGNIGTVYAPIVSTAVNIGQKFASDMARAFPDETIYLINISIGNTAISQWMEGASSPDVFQNILNNITPALTAAGGDRIDLFLWWQGENDFAFPDDYADDWETVYARFLSYDWFPVSTPVVLFGVEPASLNEIPGFDTINEQLEIVANANRHLRMFTPSEPFESRYWADGAHMTGEGYFVRGRFAVSQYLGDIGNPAKHRRTLKQEA